MLSKSNLLKVCSISSKLIFFKCLSTCSLILVLILVCACWTSWPRPTSHSGPSEPASEPSLAPSPNGPKKASAGAQQQRRPTRQTRARIVGRDATVVKDRKSNNGRGEERKRAAICCRRPTAVTAARSDAIQSASSHAARRDFRGLENTVF